MIIRYASKDLEKMEQDAYFTNGFDGAIVRAFRKAIKILRTAEDERDIRQFKSLRMEKLKGKRSHQNSIRLNDQWRLVFEIESADPKNVIVVISMEDYH